MRKQKTKTDRRDAAHILKLLIEGRFPRLWTPSAEQRNLRQLLIHRHKLVGIRVQAKNGLQHLMLNRGVQLKEKLWSQAGQKALRELTPAGWAAQRRNNLLSLLASLNEQIGQLDQATEKAAEENQEARLLMTHPGVGPITALAFVLTLGDVTRFKRCKQVASYLGLVPREHSSSGKQRLGSISKQGNSFSRMLLARWATKTAMVIEAVKQAKNDFYSAEQRHDFRTTLMPPIETAIWVGRCAQSNLLHGEARKLHVSNPTAPNPLEDGCATTFVTGRLVIQVLSIFIRPSSSHLTIASPCSPARLYPPPRSVFRSCPNPRPDLRDSVPRLWQTALPTAASWRDLNQESPHGAAGAAGVLHAAWVSFV